MERLSGDYNRGYMRAILDLIDVFDYIESDLRHHHKRMTEKTAKELLKCCLNNREALREQRNGFIRWNCVKKEFEFYKTE